MLQSLEFIMGENNPRLSILFLIPLILTIGVVSILPFSSAATTADTECREGQTLVKRLSHGNYACIAEETAERWANLGIVEIVGAPTDTSMTEEVSTPSFEERKLRMMGIAPDDFMEGISTPMTDVRFQNCVSLYEPYKSLPESMFFTQYSSVTYLDYCIKIYNDPILEYRGEDKMQKVYERFIEIVYNENLDIQFKTCKDLHDDYVRQGEETFLNIHSDYSYIDNCVTIYQDPVLDISDPERIEEIFAKFKEISLGVPSPTKANQGYVEIKLAKKVDENKFMIAFQACAADQAVKHAKIQISSDLESVVVSSYKEIPHNSCRYYESNIHASHENTIHGTILESVS